VTTRSHPEISVAKKQGAKGPTLLERAAWRWLTIAILMALLFVIYTQHPYYRRGMFAPWRPFFQAGFFGWLALGLPYCFATVWRFSSRKTNMTDSALHWMLIGRGLWGGGKRLRHILKNRRVKTTMLALLVKAFYAPLMTSFLSGHTNSIARMWANRKHLPVFTGNGVADWAHYVRDYGLKLIPDGTDFSALFASSWYTVGNVRFATDVFYDVLFFVDTAWALMGYCSESQWFKNKTRSVEGTALGWSAAIFCYPPFNDVLGTYLPLDSSHPFITNQWGVLTCRILMLAAFTIYAAATVAFGMKFSNLTNRGIISRGPYRFLRHPAYVCKGFAWWMEYMPNMSFQTAFFLVGLNGVYALRAWTEERHLSKDPEYLAYKKKVPWVLIPGVW
jgi:protein-S-isoprenylcysteine O-methyltransferase Ste14